MVHESLAATHAVVTLDVALPGIVWGWIITMNMWAKSIGSGVIFMLFYLVKKYPTEAAAYRFPVAVMAIVMVNVFLFFTVIDLHQMFRFWHIFVYAHFTSAIAVGSFLATGFMGLLFLLAYASFIKKDDALFDKVLLWTVVIAIPFTLYTAGLMAQSTARELWQMPTESAQMILAATLSGSATILLMDTFMNKLSDAAKRDMGIILAFSALSAFLLYMSELIFGPMKAEEVQAVIAYVQTGGEYHTMFWIGQVFAYIVPFVLVTLSIVNKNQNILKLAALSAIAGLWVVKHVWLVIPQLLSMS